MLKPIGFAGYFFAISLFCSIGAPFLANGSTLRKLGLALIAAAALLIVWYLGAVVHLLLYGV